MPSKPLRPCNKSGCPGLTNDGTGYCKDHQHIAEEKKRAWRARLDSKRGSSSTRGYDGQWQKVRRLKFLENPLCEWCEKRGLVVAAEEIHHIVSIREAPHKRLMIDNLESLCKPCHDTTKH